MFCRCGYDVSSCTQKGVSHSRRFFSSHHNFGIKSKPKPDFKNPTTEAIEKRVFPLPLEHKWNRHVDWSDPLQSGSLQCTEEHGKRGFWALRFSRAVEERQTLGYSRDTSTHSISVIAEEPTTTTALLLFQRDSQSRAINLQYVSPVITIKSHWD